ncbi:hypothetical protein GIB67_026123 [Kingdonia uniflora]|uniref:DUF6570 domain-containing protein n=1 Tax=Kingdonia uniflora TaxID=39325 RepID=A0A7J7M344_9MAGN|nr:hypothetical protein GIB67_026123 [Kingdonia uniflora]
MSSTSSRYDCYSLETNVSYEQRNETDTAQSGVSRDSLTAQSGVPRDSLTTNDTAMEQIRIPSRQIMTRVEEATQERAQRFSGYNARRLWRARAEETPEEGAERLSIDNARRRARAEDESAEERTRRLSLNNARRAANRTQQSINLATKNQVLYNFEQGETSSRIEHTQEANEAHAPMVVDNRHDIQQDHVPEPIPIPASEMSSAQLFRKSCRDITWKYCPECQRFSTDMKMYGTLCSNDKPAVGVPRKFSTRNLMDPGRIPTELSRLTNLERILIARIHPMMFFYRVKGQQYKYSGNVINFAQDVNATASKLPCKPAHLSAILIVNRVGAHGSKEFRVRREYVRQAFFPMFSFDRLQKINKCAGLNARLLEERRLEQMSLQTIHQA